MKKKYWIAFGPVGDNYETYKRYVGTEDNPPTEHPGERIEWFVPLDTYALQEQKTKIWQGMAEAMEANRLEKASRLRLANRIIIALTLGHVYRLAFDIIHIWSK